VQSKYEAFWGRVKDFFSFKLLLGRKYGEIIYFIGFALITVYGIRTLVLVVNQFRYLDGLHPLITRGKLIGAVLFQIPIAHLMWRLLFEAYIGIIRTYDLVESISSRPQGPGSSSGISE